MRSRKTNVLQGVVLLTGVIFIALGLFFYFSPFRAFKIFSPGAESKNAAVVQSSGGAVSGTDDEGEELTEDNWLKQVINDDIISPLYYVFRALAVLLVVSGAAMVMPLFDPLRYRGLVYYNGLIFPLVFSVSMFIFMRIQKSINTDIAADTGKEVIATLDSHLVMVVLASLFLASAVLNAAGLVLTRDQARAGKE
jgi:uncharacterized membrane protein HdeD (DUF308 family)